MSPVNLVKNYITNADEIVRLAEQELDKFSIRAPGHKFNFITQYGDSNMKSLFHFNMSKGLLNTILNALPKEDRYPEPDSIVINRYDPGNFLLRHRDSIGGYWKFKLIFLRSDKPHFKWFDENDQGHLVEEEPGALLQMPINLEHEVTLIDNDEKPKYSLVLAWGV